MFFEDHAPPHFHAIYGSDELIVGISPIEILEGRSTNRVRSMVLEWAALNQQALLEDWDRCQNAQQPLPIDPLE